MLRSLKVLLPASIFALKFLEWWHASDFARQLARKATEALDLPAPVVSGMPAPKQQPQPPRADIEAQAQGTQEKISSRKSHNPPISSTSLLPIFTVPVPSTPSSDGDGGSCPICLNAPNNPTACQTGYVFCYTCIFRWLRGEHERQEQFMAGVGGAEWEDDDEGGDVDAEKEQVADGGGGGRGGREGKWESGQGRCAVTGRRVLGGTDGLRRVLV